MSRATLKANESKILVEAAANGGRIVFPTRLKAVTQQRMAGLFDQNGLTEAVNGSLHLTRAGYRIIGLRPPRTHTAASSTGETRVPTGDVVRGLLRRQEGATLSEMIDATGWLPHTTRAALSRLRSAGDTLAKSKRDDGVTCYRLLPPETVAPIRIGREQRSQAAAEIAA